jgi:F0F1-type ATP synthase membrane subunit b/b'
MIKPPDVTTLYVLVCFAITYVILKKFLFVPLGAILDERERDEQEAAALHAESLARMQKAMTEAEQTLALARREALKSREELRGQGRARLEALLAEASAAAAAAVAEAARQIETRSKELSRELPEKSRDLAVGLAEKILGRKVAA